MKIFKTFDECANEANYRDLEMQEDEKMYTYTSLEKKFSRTWHTKKDVRNFG